MASVTIEAVTKVFGRVTALDHVSLDIAEGELLVLVGPSGCGKTTLLRLIAGLDQVSTGNIWIDRTAMTNVPAKARDLAMVFQNYALYPHMTVAENMDFGLRMRGQSKAARRVPVARAAAMLGLDALLERVPAELSGGQRQRVAMGRAIARRPAVFLMDEPLSNLDAELRLAVRREIKTLQRQLGVTMIYVTHDQVEAMTLADRIAIFRAGQVQQVGKPNDLYHRPVNRFVAGFLGTPPMSLVEARIEAGRLRAPGFDPILLDAPDGPVTLGLRPEAMSLAADGSWRGTVEAVEWLGTESLIHLKADTTQLTLRQSGQARARPGDMVSVGIDFLSAHLFSGDGAAIQLTGAKL